MKTWREPSFFQRVICSILTGLMALPANVSVGVWASQNPLPTAQNSVSPAPGPVRAEPPEGHTRPQPPRLHQPVPAGTAAPGSGLRLLSNDALDLRVGEPPADARRLAAPSTPDPEPSVLAITDVDLEVLPEGGMSVLIRYAVSPDRQYVVEYRDQFGTPDFCEPWKQLPAAPHNTGEVRDTSAQPNRFYRVRALDHPQTGLFALLARDTGAPGEDGITSDPSITGEITLFGPNVRLHVALDRPDLPWTPWGEPVTEPQHFFLSAADVLQLAGGTLADGAHTVYFRLSGDEGVLLLEHAVPFVLDTTPPALTVHLDPASDSLPIGDGRTEQHWVTLAGQTEPGAFVRFEPGSLWTYADSAGAFRFDLVQLALGANPFTVHAFDQACVEAVATTTITRLEPTPDSIFDDALTGWVVRTTAPPRDGTPGTVTVRNGRVTLAEGDSFLVELERDLEVPAGAGMLYLAYLPPIFDATAANRMNDAFEVALVDPDGRPLTYTIQGADGLTPAGLSQPAVLPASPDSFFNHTQTQDPFAAPGAEVRRRNTGGYVLRADIRHLAPNSHTRLILRLINNDRDRQSAVEILDLHFVGDIEVPFLPGSPPPAFSLLPPSANTVSLSQTTVSVNPRAPASRPADRNLLAQQALDSPGPPLLVVETPTDTAELPPGELYLAGFAICRQPPRGSPDLGPNRLVRVAVNGVPVEALDLTGNFFTKLELLPGRNLFLLTATDAYDQTSTETVTILGKNDVEAKSSYEVVTASVQVQYGRTAFNDWTKTLYADAAIVNQGTYAISGPLLVGVTGITDPTVHVLGADGLTEGGIPYYDFTGTMSNATLAAGSTTAPRTLAFANPNRAQFSHELVVLGTVNIAPRFVTLPPLEVVRKQRPPYDWNPYSYSARAVDPDGDLLTYSLGHAPAGMAVDPVSGLLTWTPREEAPDEENNDQGLHSVLLLVDDGRGGLAEQRFTINVLWSSDNRSPYFVSHPVTEGEASLPLEFEVPSGFSLRRVCSIDKVESITALAISFDRRLYVLSDRSLYDFVLPHGPLLLLKSNLVQPGRLLASPPSGPFGDILIHSSHNYAEGRKDTQGSVMLTNRRTGQTRTLMVGHPQRSVGDPYGLALGPGLGFGSDLYVMDFQGHPTQPAVLSRVDPTGHVVVFAEGGLWSTHTFPMTVVFSPLPAYGRYAYVADYHTDTITRVDEAGRVSEFLRGISPMVIGFALNAPFIPGMYVLSDDQNMYHVASDGTVSTFAERLPRAIDLNTPMGDFLFDETEGRMLIGVSNVVFEVVVDPGRRLYSYSAQARDPDNDPLKFTLLRAPQGMRINQSTGAISWAPRTEQVGLHEVAVQVSDGLGGLGTQVYNVLVQSDPRNHAPVIVSHPGLQAYRGQRYSYTVEAVDPDEDQLEYSLLSAPTGAVLDHGNGQLTWYVPGDTVGQSQMNIQVADGRGGLDLQQFTVDVVPLGDLNVSSVSRAGLEYDGQCLTVRGEVSALVKNVGAGLVQAPFEVRFFEDRNVNGAYDSDVDLVLGAVQVSSDLAPGDEVTVRARAAGTCLFPGSPVWALVDSQDAVPESDERNNLGRSGLDCVIPPGENPPEGDAHCAPDLLAGHATLHGSPPDITVTVGIGNGGCSGVAGAVSVAAYDGDSQSGGRLLGVGWTSRDLEPGEYEHVTIVLDSPPIAGLWLVADDDGTGAGTVAECDESNNRFTPGPGFTFANHAPEITSVPITDAQEGLQYRYTVQAHDPDPGDVLHFTLRASPDGMRIAPLTGTIAWNPTRMPTATHTVEVLVTDQLGARDCQLFRITVADTLNSMPLITSVPPVSAVTRRLYSYFPETFDPDGDPVTYELLSAPDGVGLHKVLGTMVWHPAYHQVGTFPFVLEARDGRGGVDLQSWQVRVVNPNTSPEITSTPSLRAQIDRPYEYVVRAQDAEGQALTFSLVASPSNMNLAAHPDRSTTALLRWIPTQEQRGDNTVIVVVADEEGEEARQTFTVVVVDELPNGAPCFTSEPVLNARVGIPYRYLVRARDPDGDPIEFVLQSGPSGMTLAADPSVGYQQTLLSWTPAGLQLGQHPVRLAVTDGRGGMTVQEFTVEATTRAVNGRPRILSSPAINATLEEVYSYDLRAEDPDGDLVVWQLTEGPTGMSLDPLTGSLRWKPGRQHVGTVNVVVTASDTLLATDTQLFSIDVQAINGPPQIVSLPVTEARSDMPYFYAARALDPDQDTVTWSMIEGPPGMTLDAKTGVVRWTPTDYDWVLWFRVAIQAQDGRGGAATQEYRVAALPSWQSPLGGPPVIVSQPRLDVGLGETFRYELIATHTDPDGLQSFGLLIAPEGVEYSGARTTPQGEAVLVQWLAREAGHFEFLAIARDWRGQTATQRFIVRVRPNRSPSIGSVPLRMGTPDVTYRYDVRGWDPEGDTLDYRLNTAPEGMTMDALGRITWLPGVGDLGEHPVTVQVTDAFGGVARQEFVLSVAADEEPPVVQLEVGYNMININTEQPVVRSGSEVNIRVLAADDVGVRQRFLHIEGAEIPLGPDGSAMVPFPVDGGFEVVGTATDAAGNTGSATEMVSVVDPSKESTVKIEIHTPENGADLTRPAAIIATITSERPLSSYTVDFAELTTESAAPETALTDSRLNYQRLNAVSFPEGESVLVVERAVVAQFDPTLLQNGFYLIRVRASDIGGQGQVEGIGLNVTGDLKFGEFRLEFTDLSIPVAGMPITVTRVYDSRESRRKGDFGFGWRLGVQDARILEVGKRDGFGFMGDESSFTTATRVYLTTPDGRRVGFTFAPQLSQYALFGPLYRPAFRSDPGVYDQLIPNDLREVWVNGNGTVTAPLFTFIGYDPSGYTLVTKDGTRYQYDERRGLQRITDTSGNRLEFTAAGIAHYPAGATEPDQRVRFERDPLGRISRITDPTGNVLTYTYDHAGDLRAFTDQGSNTTEYAYHALRPHYLETITDPLGREVVRSEFDEDGRLKSITDAAGKTVHQDFDFDQNIGTFTGANGHITYSQYDDRGNETAKWLPGYFTNRFEYDTNNNQVKSVDGRGYVTERRYDARGNLTNIVDALSNATAIAYNTLNKPTQITDALGRTTRFGYDTQGQLTNVLNALGDQAAFSRDAQGRVTSVTDFNGHTTTYDYAGGCSCGKPGKVINPDGTFRLYDYNGYGQLTREENELGHATTYHYDRYGILLWHEDALSNRTEYGYMVNFTGTGLVPRLIAVTDPLNRTTKYGYDAMYRTNTITDANGGVVHFDYDAHGNRTVVTDPVTNTTRFYYDAANRLSHQVDPWGRTNFFAYDPNGNRIEAIDRNGRRRTFGYDALNRRTNEVWWEGEAIVRTLSYGFNALGVMTNAVDPASHLTFEFDALNRLERSIQSGVEGLSDFTLTYTYDGMTNVVSVTDNWGVQVLSEYDSRNRLAKRIWQGGEIPGVSLQFAYDAAGFRTNILRYADVAGTQLVGQSHYDYNPVGAMTGILHANGSGEALAVYHYTRDPAQQIIARTLNAQLTTYGYDLTGQLTNAVYTPPTQPDESYRYDLNGNRINGDYVVSTNNQIIGDGMFTYGYDPQGSLVARTNTAAGTTTTYRYDYRNRLASVVEQDTSGSVTQRVEFTYDVLSRRIAKRANGTAIRFLLNQEHIWSDADGDGTVTTQYLLGDGIDQMLSRRTRSDGVRWYLTDETGTVRDICDSNGARIDHIDYTLFGTLLRASEADMPDRFGFAGREFDEATGLMYYRARYYSARLGRFISEDPIGFGGGDANLYRYALNAPTHFTDPSGKFLLEFASVLIHKVLPMGKRMEEAVIAGRISDATIGRLLPDIIRDINEHLPRELQLALRGYEYISDAQAVSLGVIFVVTGTGFLVPVLGVMIVTFALYDVGIMLREDLEL